MLGTIDRDHVSRLVRLLAAGDAPGVVEAVAQIDEQFPDYARLLEDLARVLQRIAVFQVVGAIDIDDELDDAELAELAESLAPADVQLFYQTALVGRRDLHLAPDPRSGAEMTLLRMLAFRPADAGSASNSGGSGSSRPAAKSSAASAPAKVAPVKSAKPAKASTEVSATWNDPDWAPLASELGLGGAVRMLASNCALLRREGGMVYLSIDPRSESLLTRSRKQALAEALSKHFGEPLSVDISIGEAEAETPVQQESRLADERMEAARVRLESDPNVQAMKDMFGAELKTDSIELINPPQDNGVGSAK
jgi:DNA polymerase-3 subunit gamma/tau